MSERYTIAFVNDELKAPLAATIAFAKANGVDAVEVRSIDGRNFRVVQHTNKNGQAYRAPRDY